MSQEPIPPAAVQLVLARLQTEPLPEENVAQTCYLLGWLEALDAVAAALDIDVTPLHLEQALRRAPAREA